MASIFKRRDRKGAKSGVWYYKYRDCTGSYAYGIGWPDKKKTREHALTVEAEHRAIRNGEKEAPPSWLRQRNKPINEVIDEYLDWGRAQGGRGGRPWAKQHAEQKKRWLRWWVNRLNLAHLADVTLVAVERAARDYATTRSQKTANNKVEALRSMCRWAVKRCLLASDPLAGFIKFNEEPSAPHRPLQFHELAALMHAAPPNRQLWYKVALATGYRVGELKHLKVENLDRFMPSLSLEAAYTKNRKAARQPISSELADTLAETVEGKPSDASLLDIPMREAWEPLNKDRDKAGIRAKTHEGRATWHSLRKVYVDAVVRTGADLKTIGTLARHSWQREKITMDVYASVDIDRLKAAAVAAYEDIMQAIEAACSACVPQAVAVNEPTPTTPAHTGAYDAKEVVGGTGLEPVTSWV